MRDIHLVHEGRNITLNALTIRFVRHGMSKEGTFKAQFTFIDGSTFDCEYVRDGDPFSEATINIGSIYRSFIDR
jgi:hypothetical protein